MPRSQTSVDAGPQPIHSFSADLTGTHPVCDASTTVAQPTQTALAHKILCCHVRNLFLPALRPNRVAFYLSLVESDADGAHDGCEPPPDGSLGEYAHADDHKRCV
jgi:hypothetical protein